MLLEIRGLSVEVGSPRGAPRTAVGKLDLDVAAGETVALVGESGCGKSLSALAIMDILPHGARIAGGSIKLDGRELIGLEEEEFRKLRGNRMAMIFQDPVASFNPVIKVGIQVGEAIEAHQPGVGRAARERMTIELLEQVGVPEAARRYHSYPHELSGGLLQRMMIAAALANDPDLIIADEPTTALDVTVQAQILELLKRIQHERDSALLLITHDLGVVDELADRVAIMYAGEIVEAASRQSVLDDPKHPYTRGLLACVPTLDRVTGPLPSLPGSVPRPGAWNRGCRFSNRCEHAWERCETHPELLGSSHPTRCWLYEEEGST